MCFLVVATKLIKKIFLSFRKNILPLSFEKILPCSVMVAHQFLALLVWVRILARQQKKATFDTDRGIWRLLFFFAHNPHFVFNIL